MVTIIMQVAPPLADSLRQTQLHGAPPANQQHRKLEQLITELGLTLKPVTQTSEDPKLMSFFLAESAAPSVQTVVDHLRAADGVLGVFVKPEATLP